MSESGHVRWGTMTGLDPELVRQLAECKRAREERETAAIDLDALSREAPTRAGWLARIRALFVHARG